MANWRGEEGDDKPGKAKGKPPRPAPVKARPSDPAIPKNKPKTDWRGRPVSRESSGVAGPGQDRSWTGSDGAEQQSGGGTLVRWGLVGLMTLVTFAAIGGYLWWLFSLPGKLPLHVISVGRYDDPELVESPFGNATRQALRTLNPNNVTALPASTTDNDNYLSGVVAGGLKRQSSRPLRGGGPGGRLVTVYVNALATERESRLLLLPQTVQLGGSASAESLAGSGSEVELKLLLEKIAESVHRRSTAWVVLDLHRFPDVGTFREIAWEGLVEAAWTGLAPELRNRLVVTVACGDGQENWPSAELGASFFGHFFQLGLAGGFVESGQILKVSSLADFRRILDREVEAAAAQRRYAVQRPVWLIPEGLPLGVPVVGANAAAVTPPTPLSGLEARFARLLGLWRGLAEKRPSAWRWDPLGFAVAESRLIQLEQLATWASDAAFETAAGETAARIQGIAPPSPVSGVSLVEKELHERFLFSRGEWNHDYDAVAAALASSELPSFMIPPPAAGAPAPPADPAAAPPPPSDAALADGDRGLFVWNWFVRQAAAVERPDRLNAFRLAFLTRALQSVEADPGWLEIRFLRLLRDEVEWSRTENGSQREEAAAQSVALFHRFQILGCQPVPELSWWLAPGLAAVESRFLRGFDFLLAGDFARALREFEAAAVDLDRMEAELPGLVQAIAARDESQRLLPHLVLHALREYQYAAESGLPAIESRMKKLAALATESQTLGSRLTQPPTWPVEAVLVGSGATVARELAECRGLYSAWLREQTEGDRNAKLNPQTFRNTLLALQSPLTAPADRVILHDIASKFLAQGVLAGPLGEKANPLKPPQRSSSPALGAFLAGLATAADREVWSELLNGTLRAGIGQRLPGQVAFNTGPANSPTEWRTSLMSADETCRRALPAIAGAFSAQRYLPIRAWPWSASQQRWRFDSASYRLMQTRRLANAGWGDADIDQVAANPEQYFFWKLATRYRPEELLTGTAPIDGMVTWFRDQWLAELTLRAQALGRMKARFGKAGEEVDQNRPTHSANMVVEGDPLPAVGEISLEHQGRPMDIQLESGLSTQTLPLDLAENDRRYNGLQVPLDAWTGGGRVPDALVRLRGNWRRTPVDWKLAAAERVQYRLELLRDPQPAATVRVLPPTKPPVINVVLLFDCSDSMDIDVDRPSTENQPNQPAGRAKLLELVKDQAVRLLQGLERVQLERQADVNFCLMPFGMKAPPQSEVTFEKVNSQIWRSPMNPLEGTWKDRVVACIGELQPQGATPLYDAMREACLMLQKQPGTTRLVYVLSDGVNDTRGVPELSGTIRSVRENLGDCRLTVFHFDYFDIWIERALQEALDTRLKTDPEFRRQYEEYYQTYPERLPEYFRPYRAEEGRLKETGVSELKGLNDAGGGFVYHRYEPSEFNTLVNDLEMAIPRLKVTVSATNGWLSSNPDQREFLIEGGLPCDVTVTAEGPWFGKATRTVRVVGGESVSLTYDINGPSLRMPRFRDENDEFELADPSGNRKPGQPVLYLNRIGDQTGQWKYLFGFGESDSRNDTFVQRPAFLVAEVTETGTGQKQGRQILLADHGFLPGRHFPVAETSLVNLGAQRHRMRVWYAATVPECVERVETGPDHDDPALQAAVAESLKRLGMEHLDFRVAREGNRMTCTLDYPDSPPGADRERLFVVCPTAVSATRDIDLTHGVETFVFVLPPSAGDGQDSDPLWLVTPQRLNDSLDANLQRHDTGPGR